MQQIAVNWTTFGWSLGVALIFGVLYAGVVRWASRKNLQGQTAWSVVVGVTFVLVIMIPVFGLFQVALIFCFFAAAGVPMVVEYLDRVQKEAQQDRKNAHELAKELLNNDKQTGDR